jgi:hypothetical protein
VDDEPSRLVDHDEVVVLVKDVERDVGVGRQIGGLGREGRQLDDGARFDSLRSDALAPVDEGPACLDPALHGAARRRLARALERGDEELVEPVEGGAGRRDESVRGHGVGEATRAATLRAPWT